MSVMLTKAAESCGPELSARCCSARIQLAVPAFRLSASQSPVQLSALSSQLCSSSVLEFSSSQFSARSRSSVLRFGLRFRDRLRLTVAGRARLVRASSCEPRAPGPEPRAPASRCSEPRESPSLRGAAQRSPSLRSRVRRRPTAPCVRRALSSNGSPGPAECRSIPSPSLELALRESGASARTSARALESAEVAHARCLGEPLRDVASAGVTLRCSWILSSIPIQP